MLVKCECGEISDAKFNFCKKCGKPLDKMKAFEPEPLLSQGFEGTSDFEKLEKAIRTFDFSFRSTELQEEFFKSSSATLKSFLQLSNQLYEYAIALESSIKLKREQLSTLSLEEQPNTAAISQVQAELTHLQQTLSRVKSLSSLLAEKYNSLNLDEYIRLLMDEVSIKKSLKYDVLSVQSKINTSLRKSEQELKKLQTSTPKVSQPPLLDALKKTTESFVTYMNKVAKQVSEAKKEPSKPVKTASQPSPPTNMSQALVPQEEKVKSRHSFSYKLKRILVEYYLYFIGAFIAAGLVSLGSYIVFNKFKSWFAEVFDRNAPSIQVQIALTTLYFMSAFFFLLSWLIHQKNHYLTRDLLIIVGLYVIEASFYLHFIYFSFPPTSDSLFFVLTMLLILVTFVMGYYFNTQFIPSFGMLLGLSFLANMLFLPVTLVNQVVIVIFTLFLLGLGIATLLFNNKHWVPYFIWMLVFPGILHSNPLLFMGPELFLALIPVSFLVLAYKKQINASKSFIQFMGLISLIYSQASALFLFMNNDFINARESFSGELLIILTHSLFYVLFWVFTIKEKNLYFEIKIKHFLMFTDEDEPFLYIKKKMNQLVVLNMVFIFLAWLNLSIRFEPLSSFHLVLPLLLAVTLFLNHNRNLNELVPQANVVILAVLEFILILYARMRAFFVSAPFDVLILLFIYLSINAFSSLSITKSKTNEKLDRLIKPLLLWGLLHAFNLYIMSLASYQAIFLLSYSVVGLSLYYYGTLKQDTVKYDPNFPLLLNSIIVALFYWSSAWFVYPSTKITFFSHLASMFFIPLGYMIAPVLAVLVHTFSSQGSDERPSDEIVSSIAIGLFLSMLVVPYFLFVLSSSYLLILTVFRVPLGVNVILYLGWLPYLSKKLLSSLNPNKNESSLLVVAGYLSYLLFFLLHVLNQSMFTRLQTLSEKNQSVQLATMTLSTTPFLPFSVLLMMFVTVFLLSFLIYSTPMRFTDHELHGAVTGNNASTLHEKPLREAVLQSNMED